MIDNQLKKIYILLRNSTVFALLAANAAHAQDAGSLLRDAERERLTPTPANPVLIEPARLPAPETAGPKFRVEKFYLEGNTRFSDAALQTVLAPWSGSELSFAELQQAADAITEHYRRAGYLIRAYLPEQDLKNGSVKIIIIEAVMGQVQIEDGGKALRLSKDRLRDTLGARQKQGDAFNLEHLQRGINLVNDMPGASATIVLSPSATPGATDVIMKLMDKPMYSGSVQLDNNGSRSTGDNKLSGNLAIDNPANIGDQIQLAGAFTAGSDYLRLGYMLPVGNDGLRIGAHSSYLQYQLGKELIPLNATGRATTLGLDARYPILRGSTDNLSLTGTFDTRSYLNNANALVTSDKTVNVATVGLSGDRLDGFGGGGFTFVGAFVSSGRLDLSGNAADLAADQVAAQKNGNFTKLAWNAGRLQKLGAATNLWFSASGQFAGKNLDSSESFSLGGPAGVRAYPNMEGTGDDGWLMTAEVRQTLNHKLMLAGFYDHGHVVQHKNNWAGWNAGNLGQPAAYDLKGLGAALTWTEAGNYTAKLVISHRLGSNPLPVAATGNDGDSTKVLNRIWANLVKYF